MEDRGGALPRTARELFRLPLAQRVLYFGAVELCEAARLWEYPMRARGDLERMRFLDKVYWIYKTTHPVRRARRGSGLEAYFADAARRRCALPDGFRSEAELRLSAAGDLMSHPFLSRSRGLYDGVADLVLGADVAMANLECPVVPVRKPLVLAFDEPAALVLDRDELEVVGGADGRRYDLLATACNHSLDHGVEGVEGTLGALGAAGIAQSGLNVRDEDADRATLLERGGFRLGLVAYTFGLNAHRPPRDRPRLVSRMALNDGVAANDFGPLTRQIAHARAAGVELVIAQLHWGLEHELFPIPEQVELAHHLAELGVDLVVGHHPHVLQPFEVYRARRDGGRLVPIYYSLGNLVNPFSAPYLRRSGIARVTLARGALPDGTRRTLVAAAELREVVQEVDEARRTIRLVAA